MLINNAYQALATKGYRVDNVITGIKKYGASFKEDSVKGVRFIDAAVQSGTVDVDSFLHPIEVDGVWYCDVRFCTKLDMRSMQTVVANAMDYAFTLDGTRLCALFESERGKNWLMSQGLLVKSFSSWIAETVARRFSLDHGTQYRLSIASAVYWYSLFFKPEEWNEDTKNKVAMNINRELNIDSVDVFAMLDLIEEPFTGIDSFCNFVATKLENVRLEKFNTVLLYTLVGGTWMGYNAREVACVALEHVPTFASMVHMAAFERGFNGTVFTKLVERKGKRDFNDFHTKLENYYRQLSGV